MLVPLPNESLMQFGAVALRAVTLAVLEAMPEGEREEFAKLSERKDPTTLAAFLDRVVPTHALIVKRTVEAALARLRELAVAVR